MVPSGITPNLVRLSGKVIYLLSTAYGHRESTFVLRLSIGKHPNPLRYVYVYIVLKNEPPYARSASILAFSENSSLFVSWSGESSDDEGICFCTCV